MLNKMHYRSTYIVIINDNKYEKSILQYSIMLHIYVFIFQNAINHNFGQKTYAAQRANEQAHTNAVW